MRTFLNAITDISEEYLLRDAARCGSSGEGPRLEARDDAGAALVRCFQQFLDTLVIGKARKWRIRRFAVRGA
jgi:hypothetical protein